MRALSFGLVALTLAGCSVNILQPSIGSGNKVSSQITTHVNTGEVGKSIRPSGTATAAPAQASTDETTEGPRDLPSAAPAPQESPRWMVQSSGTSNDLLALSFSDATSGYVVGKSGTIIKTTNGGRTWQPVQSPGQKTTDLTSVWFTDALNGWVGTYDGHIFHTNDGGETWELQFTNPEHNFQDQPWAFTSLRFLTAGTGYAAGHFLYKTDDGGKTWLKEQTGCGAEYLDVRQDAVLASGDSCAALEPGTSGWERLAGSNNVGAMAIASATEVWSLRTATYGPYVSHTMDGGVKWLSVTPRRSDGVEIRLADTNLGDMDFVDSDHGWFVNMRNVISTQDGGKTWETVEAASSGILTAIQMIDLEGGFAVGTQGRVVRYARD